MLLLGCPGEGMQRGAELQGGCQVDLRGLVSEASTLDWNQQLSNVATAFPAVA